LRQFSTCFWLSTGTPSQFRNLAVHNIELSSPADQSQVQTAFYPAQALRRCTLGVYSNDLL
jgi:hypothetical protein